MTSRNSKSNQVRTAKEIDWNRCWAEFAEGMRRMAESVKAMEKIHQDTFVWDRPISR